MSIRVCPLCGRSGDSFGDSWLTLLVPVVWSPPQRRPRFARAGEIICDWHAGDCRATFDGALLQSRRQAIGVGASDVADRIGVSPSSFRDLESGNKRGSLPVYIRWLIVLEELEKDMVRSSEERIRGVL